MGATLGSPRLELGLVQSHLVRDDLANGLNGLVLGGTGLNIGLESSLVENYLLCGLDGLRLDYLRFMSRLFRDDLICDLDGYGLTCTRSSKAFELSVLV